MPSIWDAKSIEIRKSTNSIMIGDWYHLSCFWPALSKSDFDMFTILLLQQVRAVCPLEQVGDQQWKRVSLNTLICSSIPPQNLQDILKGKSKFLTPHFLF